MHPVFVRLRISQIYGKSFVLFLQKTALSRFNIREGMYRMFQPSLLISCPAERKLKFFKPFISSAHAFHFDFILKNK